MRAVLTTVAHVEYYGTEHLPTDGPVIVATNHLSRMDTLFLFINARRPDITALVAEKYKKYPVFSWFLEVGGVIWLDRDKADFGAFKKAAEVIKTGVAMGIAPEGTRSSNGQLLEGKPGVVLLQIKTHAPIVPVAIAGTETFFKRLLTLRRPQVTLTFGPALQFPALERETRDQQLKAFTDEVMCQIAVMLPPNYWGAYRDHPRLKELLQAKAG